MKLRYVLKPTEEKAIMEYLSGKLGARELGQKLGLSHQGALNLLPKFIRDSVMDGRLKLTWKP